MNRIVAAFVLALTLAIRAFAFEAGAAKVEITPPLDTPLNGYFDRMGRGCVAVHDPLWARSLYLSDGKTSVLLVNADLCMINRELRDRVLELVPADVPKENIILTATHTHSAQGAMNHALFVRSVSGRFMPEVLEATAQKIVESIKGALANKKRGTIGFDVATQDTLTENRQVPGGPIDHQIGVIRVDDSDGNPISIIANMAAHPTTVGGDDQFSVSADYPGVYYNALEALAGEGCVAMFLNGAEGNQRPANPEKLSGWAHTEWVGNKLAEKVMEAAKKITGGEATLAVNRATPALPLTLASSIVPSTTTLTTLEINDLVLSFVPGEPCVQIGLELRNRAIQRGFKAQFTVGLSNDYLMYFVPREVYAGPYYECGMNFYGPGIERWFYKQFDALMSKSAKPSEDTTPPAAKALDIANGAAYQLTGNDFAVGFQQGAALKDQIKATFQSVIVKPCDDGTWIPTSGWWTYAPSFMNLTPLALPRLAIGTRPMLATLSPETLDTMEGIAAGAEMPFDAIWLLQCAPTIQAAESLDAAYRSPFCTMLAIAGDRAGTDQILVGRNFDWPNAETPVLFDVQPKSGMRYVQVGFAWTAGAYTGMNEAGLVVAAERVESLGKPLLEGPPIDMVLHEVLLHDRSVAEALSRLETAVHLRGYHVLLADSDPVNARVVELGVNRVTRVASGGLLYGVDTATNQEGDDAVRYMRLANLLRSQRVVDSDKLVKLMRDAEPGRKGQQRILNDTTRHSVVFEPRYKRIRVAFPDKDGKLQAPLTLNLRKVTP